MKIKIDKENDTLYLKLGDDKIIESEEIEKGIILDYDNEGAIIGIEILNISKRKNKVDLTNFHLETT